MISLRTSVPAFLVVSTLAACNGGSSGPTADNSLGLNDPSDATSDLSGVIVDLGGTTTSRATGTLDRATGDATLGSLAGTYDPATGIVTLAGGGTLELGLEGDYASSMLAQTPGGTLYGVLGIPGTNLPTTGGANYSGDAQMVIVDSAALYELAGDSTVDVVFDTDTATVVMDNLDGDRIDGMGNVTGVTDVARIELSSVAVSGDRLDGGTFDIQSGTLGTVPSGQGTLDHAGALFGPGADEVAGAFVFDDTTAGSLQVQGVYTGD